VIIVLEEAVESLLAEHVFSRRATGWRQRRQRHVADALMRALAVVMGQVFAQQVGVPDRILVALVAKITV
jgi:hypothetical protein